MSSLYKVVLHGEVAGQAIVNVLWYRSNYEAIGSIPDALLNGAVPLADRVYDDIWTEEMKGLQPNVYTLRDITVYPLASNFELLYTLPYIKTVEEAGTTQSAALPPGNCVNVRFNLQTGVWNPIDFLRPPKKSYVAISPVPEGYVDESGEVAPALLEGYQDLGDKLCVSLAWNYVSVDVPLTDWEASVGLPNAFTPVRVKETVLSTPEVIGGVTYARFASYAEILSASARPYVGYRQSRRKAGGA